MHHTVKKAAIKKYSALVTEGKNEEEIKAAIAADEKGFTTEEVNEIFAEISVDGNNDSTANQKPSVNSEETQKPLVKSKTSKVDQRKSSSEKQDFEEWNVEPQYKEITDELGVVKGRKLTGFEKSGAKPNRTTRIHSHQAEELNSQSHNTKKRLYPVE